MSSHLFTQQTSLNLLLHQNLGFLGCEDIVGTTFHSSPQTRKLESMR
jgi:hypothetical protein